MGLDNYISRSSDDVVLTPEDERVITEAGVNLCRSMLTNGITSFRGKVYEVFVAHVTGKSLAEEWLPSATLATMADKLAACDPDTARERLELDADFVPSLGEILSLQELFRICADRGLGIIGDS